MQSTHLYLFYIIKNSLQLFYFKIFHSYSKACLCPLWQTRKKSQIGPEKSCHCQTWLKWLLMEWDCWSIFAETFLTSSYFLYLFSALTKLFCTLSIPNHILSLLSKLSTILKCRRKNLCNDGINPVSVL